MNNSKIKYILLLPSIVLVVVMCRFVYLNYGYWLLDRSSVQYGVITLNYTKSPIFRFYDKNNNNIGKVDIRGKGALYEFNDGVIMNDENFFFVEDTTGYAEKNRLILVNKKNYSQKKLDVGIYPSYIAVNNKKVYVLDMLINDFVIREIDLKTNEKKDFHIEGKLEPIIALHNDDFYYFKEGKKKLSMYFNDGKEKKVMEIDGFNRAHDAECIGDKMYIICEYEDTENEQMISNMSKGFSLIIYDLKNKSLEEIKLPLFKNDGKYVYGELFYINDKIIILEDPLSPLRKQGNDLVCYDIENKSLSKLKVEEIPSGASIVDGKIYLLSDRKIQVYDKNLNFLEKINLPKREDDNRDLYILGK